MTICGALTKAKKVCQRKVKQGRCSFHLGQEAVAEGGSKAKTTKLKAKSVTKLKVKEPKAKTKSRVKELKAKTETEEPKPKSERVGLVLCHSKKHKPLPPHLRSMADRFVCLDNDPNEDPDVVSDVWKWETEKVKSMFAKKGFDVVISMYCPLENSIRITGHFIGHSRKFLKPGGKFIFVEFEKTLLFIISEKLGLSLRKVQQDFEDASTDTFAYKEWIINQYRTKLGYSGCKMSGNDMIFVNRK